MCYRDCRNFTEMLRSLGYPRLVSVENFKKHNFELIADILYWLAQRYDPHTEISDNINAEKDRI
jgi:clusterin-associated protein 1